MRNVVLPALAATALLALSGCTYDYLQNSDGLAYSAGDAVRANLQRQTIDPARDSTWSTRGLGRNGAVLAVDRPAE
jgi:hypothetical protein